MKSEASAWRRKNNLTTEKIIMKRGHNFLCLHFFFRLDCFYRLTIFSLIFDNSSVISCMSFTFVPVSWIAAILLLFMVHWTHGLSDCSLLRNVVRFSMTEWHQKLNEGEDKIFLDLLYPEHNTFCTLQISNKYFFEISVVRIRSRCYYNRTFQVPRMSTAIIHWERN